MSLFSERLKQLINENDLHYKDIEAATGIRTYTITAFVNNKCEPDLASLKKLVTFFGVTADYLVGRSNDRYPKELMNFLEELRNDILDSINKFNSKCNQLIN